MTLDLTNITNPVQFIQYVNTSIEGMLGLGIILSVGVITFMIFKSQGRETPVCAVATSFILNILGWILVTLELMQGRILLILFALLVGSFLWSSSTKSK